MAEQVIFGTGVAGLDKRITLLDAKVDARFDQLSWMIGFNLALTLLVAGLVLRIGCVR